MEAQEEAEAIVLAGRPGYHSVGFDHETLWSGGDAANELFHAGTELLLRVMESPRPLVIACTGHSLGAAALSLLCYDVRIGAAGDFRIGMDFVSQGVPVPDLAVELARIRLSPRHMTRACNTAEIYSPEGAAEAGFLDYVVTGDVVEQACEVAADLVKRLDPAAFAMTRVTACRSLADVIIRNAGDLWQMQRVAQQSGATHPLLGRAPERPIDYYGD